MDDAHDDDDDLLERWRAGDKRAGNALFERHFRSLVRFFRNKVSTGIEDLVQETLLACVRGRDRLRDDGSFRAPSGPRSMSAASTTSCPASAGSLALDWKKRASASASK